MKAPKTYYSILNVSPHATDEQVRRAFRMLALKYHPDNNPQDAQAAARYELVTRAYIHLKTAPQRHAYNRHLLAQIRRRQINGQKPLNNRAQKILGGAIEILWPFTTGNRDHAHG